MYAKWAFVAVGEENYVYNFFNKKSLKTKFKVLLIIKKGLWALPNLSKFFNKEKVVIKFDYKM